MPPKATHDPTTPAPDARLLAACERFHDVDALLRAWDAKEVELDDDGSAGAITRYWVAADSIPAAAAMTEAGQRAKSGAFPPDSRLSGRRGGLACLIGVR